MLVRFDTDYECVRPGAHPGVYRLEGATWRARVYNGGRGLCPQRGPGAEPLVALVRGSGGKAPLKLNAFWCCHKSEMALNCYVYKLFYGH